MNEFESLSQDIQNMIEVFGRSIKSIALLDYKARYLYTNEMYQERSGYTKEELLGRKVSLLKSGIHGKDFYEKLWDTLEHNEVYHAKFTNKNKKGSYYSDEQMIIPIGEKGITQNYLIIGKDISQSISEELSNFIEICEPCTFDTHH